MEIRIEIEVGAVRPFLTLRSRSRARVSCPAKAVQIKICMAMAGEAASMLLGLVAGWVPRQNLLVASVHHRPPTFSKDDVYR